MGRVGGDAQLLSPINFYMYCRELTSVLPDCGIRPSTASEAEWLQDFINRTNNARNQNANSRPTSQSGRSSSANEDDSPDDDDEEANDSSHHTSSGLPHL